MSQERLRKREKVKILTTTSFTQIFTVSLLTDVKEGLKEKGAQAQEALQETSSSMAEKKQGRLMIQV